MLKKIIPVVLLLSFIFNMSVMAENSAVNRNMPRPASEGSMRGDFDPSKIPEGGFAPTQGDAGSNADRVVPQTDKTVVDESVQMPENGGEPGQMQGGGFVPGGQMPENMGRFPANMQISQDIAEEQPMGFLGFITTYSTPIISIILLGLAYVFVIFYKRKNY